MRYFMFIQKKYPTTANDYEVIWDEDGILIHGINETYGVYVENAAWKTELLTGLIFN